MSDFFFFFCTMKMFCLGVYFILAQSQAGTTEGTWARSSVWCSTLRFIHLTWFLSDVVKCQKNKQKNSRKQESKNRGELLIKVILSESYCECDPMCLPKFPTAEHITSHVPGDKSSGHQVSLTFWTAGGASNVQGLADEDCNGYWDKQQTGQVTVKHLSLLECLVFRCMPSTCHSVVLILLLFATLCGALSRNWQKDPAHFF